LSLLLLYTIIRCVYLQLSYLDVFFLVFAYPSYLPSFPTRRSSDLSLGAVVLREPRGRRALPRHGRRARETLPAVPQCGRVQAVQSVPPVPAGGLRCACRSKWSRRTGRNGGPSQWARGVPQRDPHTWNGTRRRVP